MMSEEEAEREDITGPDDEDIINSKVEEEMRLRGRLPHISFFAFTATPKNKTMELFGTLFHQEVTSHSVFIL